MTEYFAADGGSCREDVRANNEFQMESISALNNAFHNILHEDWLEHEPGERCFDHDSNQMSQAYALLSGELDEGHTEMVHDHLISCPRCRFILGALQEEVRPQTEPVPASVREPLHSSGLVVFPGGEVADETWEFGLLDELDPMRAEEIVEIVASQAAMQLCRVVQNDLLIVCFGKPIHRCGKRLAAKLVQAGGRDIHVAMADDFHNPKLWCDPLELKGKNVVIFVDVVHSGGLIRRLFQAARLSAPREIFGLTVIDQSEGAIDDLRVIGLWQEPPERRTLQIFDECDINLTRRFFDAASGRTFSQNELPHEIRDGNHARHTIEEYLQQLGPLFSYIVEADALQCDTKIGSVCYPWVVDLLALLRHPAARSELLRRAKACLQQLNECGSWCLVFPAERSRRAGTWARALGEELGWPVIGIGRSNRQYDRTLTPKQRTELSKYVGAVVVDAAIRTGKTLQSFIKVLGAGNSPLVKQIVPFYAIDGLFADARKILEGEIGEPILSLFRLPLGAPTDPVSKHCRRHFANTLEDLKGLHGDNSWAEVVKSYCTRKLAPGRHPTKRPTSENTMADLGRAIDEGNRGSEARLERSCESARPSTVKQLDVSFALQEPRTRNVLHGFLCNSMPNEFIEWCALALSTQDDFAWFDKDWLTLHKQLLTNTASERWQFLAFVGYRMKESGKKSMVAKAHQDVERFRQSQSPQRSLFPEIVQEPNVLQSRCDVLLDVLS